MVFPAFSRLRFRNIKGQTLEAVPEWEAGQIWVDGQRLEGLPRLFCQGEALELWLSPGQKGMYMAPWPPAAAGWYQFELQSGGHVVETHWLQVDSALFSADACQLMLQELSETLPVDLTLALSGAARSEAVETAHWLWQPEQFLALIERVLMGDAQRPGLLQLLPRISARPLWGVTQCSHVIPLYQSRRPLAGEWFARERGRQTVTEMRAQTSLNTPENRWLWGFLQQIKMDLAQLKRVAFQQRPDGVLARRAADVNKRFLGGLNPFQAWELPLADVPIPVSPALYQHPDYAQAYFWQQQYNQHWRAQLCLPEQARALADWPWLYQAWCTLKSTRALLRYALEAGYVLMQQELVSQWGHSHWVRALVRGQRVLSLKGVRGQRLSLYHERSFGKQGPLRSVSYTQRPDITVVLESAEQPAVVLIFDPKYKLEQGIGGLRPSKMDLDKMHAYRDAIRDEELRPVVQFAGILYPGSDQYFGTGVGALRAHPDGDLESALIGLFSHYLGTNA